MNIQIKTFRDEFATTKFQVMDPSEMVENAAGETVQARSRGYRPLEPGEVVEVDDARGKALLKQAEAYIERTEKEANRPLFFDEVDVEEGIGIARTTSQAFNANTEEKKADKARAQEKVDAAMKKPKRGRKVEADNQ